MDSGEISSPNYPGKYPNDRICSWVINVPEGRQVALKFDEFDVILPVFLSPSVNNLFENYSLKMKFVVTLIRLKSTMVLIKLGNFVVISYQKLSTLKPIS